MLKNILSTNKFNEKDEGEKNEIGDRNKKVYLSAYLD